MTPDLQGRPAIRADIDQFYPGITASFRAKVCEIDGEPQGIIGFTLTLPCRTMFSVIREPLKPHIRSLTCLRLLKWAATELRRSALPVLAIAEPGEPEAPKILERLGFKSAGEIDGDMIYIFKPGEA